MKFRITMELTTAQLESVLTALPPRLASQLDIAPVFNGVEHEAAPAADANPPAYLMPNTVLVRGDKQPARQAATIRRMLTEHEKLEAKHGVGNVTRGMLWESALKKKLLPEHDTGRISQLVRQDYLRRL